MASVSPVTPTKPGLPPRCDMSRPPSSMPPRDRLATKKVSDAAIRARAASSRRSSRSTGAPAAARGEGVRVWMYCAQLPKLWAIATVSPLVDRDQPAVGAVAPPRGEVEAEKADLGAGDEGRRGRIVRCRQRADAERRRIGRLHKARLAGQHRGHRPAVGVGRGDEQVGQQREELAMLVGHERADGGAAGALMAGQGLRLGLVLVEGKECHVSPSRLLGELLLGVVPGCRVGSPDMDLRAIGDRRVEAAQPQQHHRLGHALGHDVRAALRAEAAELAGRGFDGAQPVRAAGPAEFFARHGGHRREGRAVRLAAGLAVAMDDAFERGVGLVGHGAAQAASGQHDVLRRHQARSGRLRREDHQCTNNSST